MWRLRLIRGTADPAEIDVTGVIVLGRGAGVDVRLSGDRVSRRHARVAVRDGRLRVEDLDSANGIAVNDVATGGTELAEGDSLRLGDVVFAVERTLDRDSRPRTVGTDANVRVESCVSSGEHAQIPDLLTWVSDTARGTTAAQRVASGTAELLRADSVVVLVRVHRGGSYRVVAAHPPVDDGEPPVSRALLARAEVARVGLLLSADVPELLARESVAARAAGSALCAPIEHDGEVVGAFYAERRENWVIYEQSDLALFTGIARAAGAVLAEELVDARRGSHEAALLVEHGGVRPTPLLIGASPTYLAVLDVVERVAGLRSSVLLVGERGTGRKTLARAMHHGGQQDGGPFVVVPCPELGAGREAALLMGEVTPDGDRTGLLGHAAGGTVCLAEVDRLSASGQEALAGALATRALTPVGGVSSAPLRVRVVATADPSLARRVGAGEFAADLHALLAPVLVHVPSLRSRPEDVGLLARHFAAFHGLRIRHERMRVADDVVEVLRTYPFAGNVAELSAIIQRMVLTAAGGTLALDDMPEDVRASSGAERRSDLSLAAAERAAIARALRTTGGKRGKAAELLGISWPTLTKKIRKYGLE